MQTTRYTQEQRQAHVEAWRQSGMSRMQYCQLHSLKYLTFCSWITKQQPSPKSGESKFIPVEVHEPLAASSCFATIIFSNRCTLQLHQRVEAAYLQALTGLCS